MSTDKLTPSPATAATLETIKAREDAANDVRMEVTRPDGDASVLHLYIRAPVLAEVLRKFEPGNHPREDLALIYQPILLPLRTYLAANNPAAKMPPENRIVTYPSIGRITKNFVPAVDFIWSEAPRSILLSNPDKLADGFTLVYKVDAPVPMDSIRRWGKMFMDGCNDILANARPFKMAWLMEEVVDPAAPRL